MEVIIKIKIDDTVLARMRKGEFVQGSLHYDKWTGEKEFNAYVRKSRMPGYVPPYKPLAELDNGTMNETKNYYIIHEKYEKRLGTSRVMSQMDRNNKQAKDALIERELEMIEFC